MKCPRCKGTGKVKDPETFCDRLVMLREAKGITCKDLEREAGIPHSEYWRLENGKVTNPSVKTLVALARFFGVTTDYMLGIEQ